jgi:hypothetical protein
MNGELYIPPWDIHADRRTNLHLITRLGHKSKLSVLAPKHHTAYLPLLILEREIPMPAVISLEVGDLPANQDGIETFG